MLAREHSLLPRPSTHHSPPLRWSPPRKPRQQTVSLACCGYEASNNDGQRGGEETQKQKTAHVQVNSAGHWRIRTANAAVAAATASACLVAVAAAARRRCTHARTEDCCVAPFLFLLRSGGGFQRRRRRRCTTSDTLLSSHPTVFSSLSLAPSPAAAYVFFRTMPAALPRPPNHTPNKTTTPPLRPCRGAALDSLPADGGKAPVNTRGREHKHATPACGLGAQIPVAGARAHPLPLCA